MTTNTNSQWLDKFEKQEWVELLKPLLAESKEEYSYADHREFQKAILTLSRDTNFRPSLNDGITLIQLIGTDIEIGGRREDHFSEVAIYLENFHHPKFIEAIETQYATCPVNQRAGLICVLACQDPEPAAKALNRLIEAHGFPRAYPRVVSTLSRRTEVLHYYVRAFVEAPGRNIGDAVNLINLAVDREHLDPGQLNALASLVEARAKKLIAEVREQQAAARGQWQSDEKYFYLRSDLGAYLDLVGIIPSASTSIVRDALDLEDPLIALFLVTALTTKGEAVPASVIHRAAQSYETLTGLYRNLRRARQLHLFPKERETFEHFAAAEMVQWLLYPSELGEEPKAIELMMQVDGTGENGEAERWCLWRFTDHDGATYAGISGPYAKQAVEEPSPDTVHSNNVFSNFTPWEEATAEEHLSSVLETLRNWRTQWCGPSRMPPS
ncbi:MAG: hypothetical protein AAGE43_18350 [Pseudomonadota bacterium]